jgi:hypothetical protein
MVLGEVGRGGGGDGWGEEGVNSNGGGVRRG